MKLFHRILIIFAITLFFQPSYAQVRSGVAFLKMLPGARVQAMSASQTSSVDDVHAIFINPGSAGFTREWQYSASYSKWIADVYNLSLLYGRSVRTPWSHRTRALFGVVYQGMPDFDSSDGAAPTANASDMVASLSIGQPVSFISDNISLGTNFKYYQSRLANYNASCWIFDMGVLARTPRFNLHNSLLKYTILSVGASYTQMGKNIVYDQIGTPLPKTWRVGGALYLGSHHGIQLQILADYHKIKDEPAAFGIGSEFSFGKRLSLNSGYDFDNDLLSQYSFGLSLRLDDVNRGRNSVLPGKNKALQIDIASVDEGEFFSRTYKGSANYFPICPEYFSFKNPAIDEAVTEESVVLKWEKSHDPDIYDDVNYTVLVNSDSVSLASLIAEYDKTGASKLVSDMLVHQKTVLDSFEIKTLSGGDYYWSVIASDVDNHLRFAEKNKSRIAHFYIPFPDLKIKDIEFDYSPWITENDFHGDLKITVINEGTIAAENFSLTVIDSTTGTFDVLPGVDQEFYNNTMTHEKQVIVSEQIALLEAGKQQTFTVPWHTSQLGLHKISGVVDSEQKIRETDDGNNRYSTAFHTIPKGTFTTQDTVTALTVSTAIIDMPIITDICFDQQSSRVKYEYLHKTSFDPPLKVLIDRLRENRHLKVALKGFIDPNSDEFDITLADARSKAVLDSMVAGGVYRDQVEIEPGESFKKRHTPRNAKDAQWVFEERRCVQISTDEAGQKALFLPIRHIDTEEAAAAVNFLSTIKSAVNIENSTLKYSNHNLKDSLAITKFNGLKDLAQTAQWQAAKRRDFSDWLNTKVKYSIELTDELGRTFATRANNTLLQKEDHLREHRICFPLKFANTDPIYNFYWSRIFTEVKKVLDNPAMQISFHGHACAVGGTAINDRLSKKRAATFHQGFLGHIRKSQPDYYQKIARVMTPAQGFGELKPLGIDRLNGEQILIGDNESAIGRKLNRRIEIVLKENTKMIAQDLGEHNSFKNDGD